MHKIIVIYHSVGGTTEQLAQAIVAGGTDSGADVIEIKINPDDIIAGRYTNREVLDVMQDADGIIFGSPTFMGSVSAQFKAVADASSDLWENYGWKNKLAAGFTVGTHLNGDQLFTLQYMQILAAQHGMQWIGLDINPHTDEQQRNRLGAHSGLIAQASGLPVNPTDLQTAFYLGQRMATLVSRQVPDYAI